MVTHLLSPSPHHILRFPIPPTVPSFVLRRYNPAKDKAPAEPATSKYASHLEQLRRSSLLTRLGSALLSHAHICPLPRPSLSHLSRSPSFSTSKFVSPLPCATSLPPFPRPRFSSPPPLPSMSHPVTSLLQCPVSPPQPRPRSINTMYNVYCALGYCSVQGQLAS